MEGLIRITPDKERATSLVKLAKLRYGKLPFFDEKKEAPLIIEAAYETIKELATALLYIDGYKPIDHVAIVEYLKRYLPAQDCALIDRLRRLRNDIVYRGIFVSADYIKRNKDAIDGIVRKLTTSTSKESKER